MNLKIVPRICAVDPNTIEGDIHPKLKMIYASRGVKNLLEINHELAQLTSFAELRDIDRAAECIADHIMQDKSILIIGDFDTDGATSSALAVSCLKAFGANNVNYLVPNRFEFGYGLTPEIVAVAMNFQPNLLITVDNGISSVEGVIAAHARGVKVIITDHHLPGEVVPDAEAIVNPNQKDCLFPSKNLAGVGVAFYVMCAVRRVLSARQWFDTQKIPEPNMAQFLDLVALGTVADVVPLDHNNRILVQQGLQRIRSARSRPGITALIEVGKRNSESLQAADLGYAIAPRLNAAGRLDDMSLGIECLLTQDISTARRMAEELDKLNLDRREIEQDMKRQASQALAQLHLEQNQLPLGLCLYDPSWHQGVVGIVAGRIKDKYHRPVVAFAKVSDHELKGSARSVSGFHIRDAFELIATSQPSLIRKFGGHAMAAGLTIAIDDFTEFSRCFNQVVSAELDPASLEGKLFTDGELSPQELTLEFAEILRGAGPWGQQFPEPIFANRFRLMDQRLVGQKHLKMSLALENSPDIFDAIAFNINENEWPNRRVEQIECAYRLDINTYGDRTRLQLIVEQFAPC